MNNPFPNCSISLSLSAEEALAEFIKLTAMTAAQRGDDEILSLMRDLSMLMRLHRSTNPHTQRCLQALSTASLILNSLTIGQVDTLKMMTKSDEYDLSVRHALELMMDITVPFIQEAYPSDSNNISRNTYKVIYTFFQFLMQLIVEIYKLDNDRSISLNDNNISFDDAEFFMKLYKEAYENYDEQENQA